MKKRTLGKSRNKKIFGFNSIKSGEHFRVESSLEFEACYHLEFQADISSFEAQPLGYEYQSFGKTAKYTPDFKTTDRHSNQEEMLEIKAEKEAQSRTFQEIFSQKQAAAEELNTPPLICLGCGSLETTSQGRKTKELQYINTRKEGGFMVI